MSFDSSESTDRPPRRRRRRGKSGQPRKRREKVPPKITRGYLTRAVERYLARYAAPRAHIRRLMMRRVDKSLAHHGGEREEAEAMLESILDRMQEIGAIDDERFAGNQVDALRRRGMSTRAIRAKLGQRGVDGSVIDEQLEAEADARDTEVDPDLVAACAFVRKRRMGAFRRDPEQREAMRDKDLARLARKGFSYAIAKQALELETPAEVEALGRVSMSWT